MTKRLNLPQLAHRYKTGEIKIDGLPKKMQNKIKSFAESVPADELKTMASPPKLFHRQVGPTHSPVRNVKTA